MKNHMKKMYGIGDLPPLYRIVEYSINDNGIIDQMIIEWLEHPARGGGIRRADFEFLNGEWHYAGDHLIMR